MRDNQPKVKIELLSQWKLEAEFRNFVRLYDPWSLIFEGRLKIFLESCV